MQASESNEVERFEHAYTRRAAESLGRALDDARGVVPDRRVPAGDREARFLAGWWTRPDLSPQLLVLPNPWDDRDAIAVFEEHCWGVTTRVIDRLAPVLDGILGERRGPEAWRTILAPWLLHTVSALADRRLFCVAAATVAPGLPFLVHPVGAAPATTLDGLGELRTDGGNRALVSVIVRALGLPSADAASGVEPSAPPPWGGGLAGALSRAVRRPGHHAVRLAGEALLSVPAGRRALLVGQCNVTPVDGLRLARRAPGVRLPSARLAAWKQAPAPPGDEGLRGRLAMDASAVTDPLERLVLSMMPRLLPRSILEGYSSLLATSRRRYGKPAHLLIGNYSVDEVQNEFIARSQAAGKTLSFVQHGGYYLQSRVNGHERLELRDDATFLSWGGRASHARPLPNPRLERLRGRHRGGTDVLLIEWIQPTDPYLILFSSMPLGNQQYATAKRLAEFVGAVRGARDALALKRFPYHIEVDPERPQALAELPHRPPRRVFTAIGWMARSRVVVVPYPDTPFIEAMVMGVPTIGLWDPDMWELRDDARPAFDALEAAGVIHRDPIAAATHVDSIYADPRRWWDGPATREARERFIERFAAPGDWLSSWAAYIRRLGD